MRFINNQLGIKIALHFRIELYKPEKQIGTEENKDEIY